MANLNGNGIHSFVKQLKKWILRLNIDKPLFNAQCWNKYWFRTLLTYFSYFLVQGRKIFWTWQVSNDISRIKVPSALIRWVGTLPPMLMNGNLPIKTCSIQSLFKSSRSWNNLSWWSDQNLKKGRGEGWLMIERFQLSFKAANCITSSAYFHCNRRMSSFPA